jgi:hypothetical protein
MDPNRGLLRAFDVLPAEDGSDRMDPASDRHPETTGPERLG